LRPLHLQASTALVSLILIFGLGVGCMPSDRYVKPDPPQVTVSVPIRKTVTDYIEYTGRTKAEETVELRARIKGFLKEQLFDEKTPVKKDQLLFVIDEEPYKISLEMEQAKLAESEASLKKAEQSKGREVAAATLALDQASLGLARIDERRSRTLLDRNAGTRESLDQSEATRKKAEAQVSADQASLEQANADYESSILAARANTLAAKSDVQNAAINLGYCRITSPFDGRISRRAYDVGNLVGDGSATVLATVYKDEPIYAYVTVSENDLLRFRSMAKAGKRKDFEKGDEIGLDLGLSSEPGFPHHGVLDYADPSVDPSTGTVTARGIFANPDRVIVPGLFVRVRVALQERPNALLVPERALGTDQFGRFLLVVGKGNIVEKRSVKIGAQQDQFRVIESDLGPDDLVVINGLQKAREGMEVKPIRQDLKIQGASNVATGP
jgi:RND family efflux transporter MFP subunit